MMHALLPKPRWISTTIGPLLVILGLSSGCIVAPQADWPTDVRVFIEEHEACMHWATEEPYNERRRKEIAAGVERDCRGVDRKLGKLREKYRNDSAVLRRLAEFEELGF